MNVEAVTRVAARPVARALLVQRWHDLAFLHWAAAPETIAPFLPAGTRPDTLDGVTYVDGAGRRGVVFLSLDAARLLPVLVAQASLRLPYRWASMRLDRDGDRFTYTSRRRRPGGRGPTSAMAIRAGALISEPTPLEHFLTARWGLHVRAYGRTLYLPNAHPRWPLHRAELLRLDDELVPAAGLPAPDGPPVSVLYSPGVPVRFGRPGRLR
jgi:uncharacterized protein YqjF (DUF2071 family)